MKIGQIITSGTGTRDEKSRQRLVAP